MTKHHKIYKYECKLLGKKRNMTSPTDVLLTGDQFFTAFFLFFYLCFIVSSKFCRSWLTLLEMYLFLASLIDRLTIGKVLFKIISNSDLILLPIVLEHTIFIFDYIYCIYWFIIFSLKYFLISFSLKPWNFTEIINMWIYGIWHFI